MAKLKTKHLNFGYLLDSETKTEKLTSLAYQKPLQVLDESTKFFMGTLNYALDLYDKLPNGTHKNYCQYYLTTGNAVLHIIRCCRMCLLSGYYGAIAIFIRVITNYLRLSIYIYHHPEEAKALLEEQENTFKQDKNFKSKFHEQGLKTELTKLGYKPIDENDAFAKITHGSVWSAQVFGYKETDMEPDTYHLNYGPQYSDLQSSTYLSFILTIPADFAQYFVQYISQNQLGEWKPLLQSYREVDIDVSFSINALENAYQFIAHAPTELKEQLLQRMKTNSDIKYPHDRPIG